MPLDYIHTCFENGSPLQWQTAPDGRVHIRLLYDYERASLNRAAGHWHFQLQAQAGAELNLVLENFDNIWNGRYASPLSDRTSCFLSGDGRTWRAIPARRTADNRLEIALRMEEETLFLARLEPYRVSDLNRLLAEIRAHPRIEILPIGATGEGRPLEIVRVGRPEASRRVLLRARAHPWEPGGNWLVQGSAAFWKRTKPTGVIWNATVSISNRRPTKTGSCAGARASPSGAWTSTATGNVGRTPSLPRKTMRWRPGWKG
jgi:hypothetical protein